MSSASKPMIERLRAARVTMAEVVLMDERYLPIFERIERELEAAENQNDALTRARAIVAKSQG